MAFERGGYADKLGNRFELRWVVKQYLHVLSGELVSVYHEPVGTDEEGVDVWIETDDGLREAQQCKGELAAKAAWSMADMNGKGILSRLKNQLERDAAHRFSLVSATPAPMLRDLSRSARDSTGDPVSFYRDQIEKRSKDHREAFADFCKYLQLDPSNPAELAAAFDLLSRSDFHQFSDDHETRRDMKTFADLLVDGEAENVLATLAEFANDNFRKTIHADELFNHLKSRGFRAKDLTRDDRLFPSINELHRQFDASMRRYLAGGRLIPREETKTLLKWLDNPESDRLCLLHGRAGAGKSGTLLELVEELVRRGIPYLPLRLDRQTPQGNLRLYGDTLGLPESPVACLRALAGDRPAVLILDQLDALRWTSSHAASALSICEELVRQAMATRNVRILVTSRSFDIEHDPQLKAWRKSQRMTSVVVSQLSEPVVQEFVIACGQDFARMTARERGLLRSIQNLTMWSEIIIKSDLPRFGTAIELTKQFWQSRRKELEERGVPGPDVQGVLDTLSGFMDRHGQLFAPERLIEKWPRASSAFQSLNVILIEAGRVSFCHQAYFDYLVAVTLLSTIDSGSGSVLTWLGERTRQSLFRREQLRLVLAFMRDETPSRFLKTLNDLVADDRVRFHLKHLALQVLGQINEPCSAEIDFAISLLSDVKWRPHILWQLVHADRTWFISLNERGLWREWLSSPNDDLVNAALWAIHFANSTCGDQVAALLKPYVNVTDEWSRRCLEYLPHDPAVESDELFNIRLELARHGHCHEWFNWAACATRRPRGFLELLVVHIEIARKRLWSDSLDEKRSTKFLESMRRSREEKCDDILAVGVNDSEAVWEVLFPVIEQFALTIRQLKLKSRKERLRNSGTSNYRRFPSFPSVLITLLVTAGRALFKKGPDDFFRRLERMEHKGSRIIDRIILLSFLHGPATHADPVLFWLMKSKSRFRLGTRRSRSQWEPARRLILQFAGSCSDDVCKQLEDLILSHHDPDEWESIRWKAEQSKSEWDRTITKVGQTQFHLLSALPDLRKSETAKGLEGVLQRKFAGQSQYLWPQERGVKVGCLGSSIPRDRLSKISDKAWLKIITHDPPKRRAFAREWPDGGFRESSAEMFARDLETVTHRDPCRFARLAMQIPPTANPVFLRHIFSGIQHNSPPNDMSEDEKKAWNPATADQIENVIRHSGGDSIRASHAITYCRLISQRANANWSIEAVQHVVDIATTHPQPRVGESIVSTGKRDSVEMLEADAINVARGVAADTVKRLLWSQPDRLSFLESAIDGLVTDFHPAVRVAATGVCLAVLNIDKDKAVSWYLNACTQNDDRVLACRESRRFLAYAAWTHLTSVTPILRRMVKSELPEVQKWGAVHATAIRFIHNCLHDEFNSAFLEQTPNVPVFPALFVI